MSEPLFCYLNSQSLYVLTLTDIVQIKLNIILYYIEIILLNTRKIIPNSTSGK